MLGTELAYVRARLERLGPEDIKVVSAAVGLHVKTLKRLTSKETKYGRTDTVGKLAMYFKTKEKRRRPI
jgi:hypothetical protein